MNAKQILIVICEKHNAFTSLGIDIFSIGESTNETVFSEKKIITNRSIRIDTRDELKPNS